MNAHETRMRAGTIRHTRRSVLQAAIAAGITGAGGARVAGAQGTPAGNGLVAGVDYIPSPMPGVPDAYLRAPEPYQAIPETPGKGGTVSFMTILWGPPPPNREDNAYWQELEERLGVTWEGTFVPSAQYGERTAAMLASGDLPDFFYFNDDEQAAHLNQAVQQGAFADLTDYLSGDAINEWPNLAAIDPAVYRNIAIDGRIYGIPKLVTRFDTVPFIRADWASTVGLELPADAEEFLALMQAFTEGDPDGNGNLDTWGLGGTNGGWNVPTVARMFRAPNGWRLEPDGTLINQIETDEYRQAVEFCRQMREAGVY
ncbi:MAG: extracellular solute-binding protein, partial [Chloroflexota bacterium]|nr:extracellular solute-binding protein [Chloroflexota bacterium]